MKITCSQNNETLLLQLSGRLNSSNVHELEAILKEKMPSCQEIIFDFKELETLSSAGLRVLLASHKMKAGKTKIINVNEEINNIFVMTGMSTFLNISRS